jgi:hypothetical protein
MARSHATTTGPGGGSAGASAGAWHVRCAAVCAEQGGERRAVASVRRGCQGGGSGACQAHPEDVSRTCVRAHSLPALQKRPPSRAPPTRAESKQKAPRPISPTTAHSVLTPHNKPVPTTPYSPGGGTTAHSVLTPHNKPGGDVERGRWQRRCGSMRPSAVWSTMAWLGGCGWRTWAENRLAAWRGACTTTLTPTPASWR